ncbi:MAG: hypothetical protein QM756_19880 [Polyangiaceae bacterium]
MSTRPEAKVVGPDYVLAVYDRLMLQLWQATATLEAAQTLVRFGSEWEHQVKFTLVVVDVFGSMPGPQVREELNKVSRKARATPSAVVYQETGFKAASLRAIATGILALTNTQHSLKVVSSLSEAAEMGEQVGRRPTSATGARRASQLDAYGTTSPSDGVI